MSLESIIVTITPDRLREIQRLPVIPAHAVYRMGRGPHLFRACLLYTSPRPRDTR